MAATIAEATGFDRHTCTKTVHRLGSQEAKARAATYRTFATAWVRRDGSGEIEVKRDGKVVHAFTFGPE